MNEKNVKLFPANDNEAISFISKNKQNNYLIIGHEELEERLVNNPETTFDAIFYDMAYIPLEYKWSKFSLERNIKKEKDIFHNILGLKDSEEFIFIHDDAKKNAGIIKKYPENLKIIRPDNNNISIFQYLYTIKKAKEVHCINSCFLNLIDCIQLRNNGLFFHRYSRLTSYGEQETPVLKMDWRIIN